MISGCGEKSEKLGERVIPLGQPVPKGGGRYVIGDAYQVGNTWYRPHEQPDYDRIGRASWYGELFHGRRTANGEIYDMDRLSAAHPTLPLPVYAQVINLTNGRSIVVRINDRGPFANDRIIDLSRQSAEILGFRKHGTALVRVRYLRRAPLSGDDSYERRYLASQSWYRYAAKDKAGSGAKNEVSVASAPAGPPPLPDRAERPSAVAETSRAPTPPVREAAAEPAEIKGSPEATGSLGTAPPPSPPQRVGPSGGPSIQAGSFKNRDNAERARTALADIGPVDVASIEVNGERYWRVRVGPFADDVDAATALPRVTAAGYHGARILSRN